MDLINLSSDSKLDFHDKLFKVEKEYKIDTKSKIKKVHKNL